MRCPECYRRLKQARTQGIEIDRCPSCRGVWFDAGELEAYRRSQALASGRDAGHVTFEATAPVPGSDCPHCKTATLSEGRAGDLRLYRCTECTGCFLLKPEQDGAAEPSYDALDLAWDAWLTLDFLDAAASLFDP